MNIKRYITTLILSGVLSVTGICQQFSQALTLTDKHWLSDSVQTEVARLLTEGRQCTADLIDAKEIISNRDYQISKQAERIAGFMAQVDNQNEQKATLQGEIRVCDKQLALKDKQILRLKTTKWLIIGVSGAAVIGTIVIAATL